MATDVDWVSGKISIQRADMPLVQASPELRSLDVAQLKLDLGTLHASKQGAPYTRIFTHNPEATAGGFTYARVINIVPPYFIEFEDGQYGVLTGGANHNLMDITVQNQVRLATQNSGGLIRESVNTEMATSVRQIQYKIESTDTHQGTGEWIYVDPVNGNDSYDGTSPDVDTDSLSGPLLTFSAAMMRAERHDVIYFVKSGSTATLTENLVIDKEVHVRGPGPSFIVSPADNTVSTIEITAPHVSLTNFSVRGDVAGSAVACVECRGPEPLLKNLVVYGGNNHGVYLSSSVTDFTISGCIVHDNSGSGIHAQESTIGKIHGGRSYNCITGVHLSTASAVDGFIVIDGIYLYDNSISGITIDVGYAKSVISGVTYFANNGSAQVGGADPEWDIVNNEPTTKLVANFYNPDDRDALSINASDAAVLPLV